jgi:FkbM family methyltransferase
MRGKSRLIVWAYHRFNASDQCVESTLDRSLKLRLHLNIWVDFNIYCWGLYEYYLANYFKQRVRTDTVFLDVGAYIGQYALLAARQASRGRVFAFEPHPESARRAKEIARQNHLLDLQVINKAVGESVGTIPFYIARQPFQSSAVASHTVYQRTVEVPVTTLDTFCTEQGITHVDMIKIDVEEAENEVIRGAARLIKRARPLIIIEIGKKSLAAGEPESLRYLSTMGYNYFTLRRDQLRPLLGPIIPGTNVIAIPGSSL